MVDIVSLKARRLGPQDVTLTVAGTTYAGWTDVEVVRSMEAAAGGFRVSYSAQARIGWRIEAGAEVTVTLAGRPVIRGFVDAVEHTYDADGHTLSVSGRDATGDLVDCTADHTPAEWRGLLLEEIVAVLASPFHLAVTAEVNVPEPFPVFRLEPGETAFEAIERACRLRECLAMPDGGGGLLITRAGKSGTASGLLTGGAGGNVLTFSRSEDHSDRFSEYRFLAQRQGDADGTAADFAHVEGSATDPGVTRHRPLVLPAEDAADPASATARARWEAAVRRARAVRATVSVVGWTDAAGSPWRPNTHVRHRDPWDGDTDYLIATVRHSLSAAGTLTEMDLALPDAYLTEPAAVATAETRRKARREKALDALLEREEVTW